VAPAVVQHASGTLVLTSGTTGTCTVTLGAAATPGNCLVALIVAQQKTAGSAPTVTGVLLGGAADNWAAAVTPPTASNTGFVSSNAWTDQDCAGGSAAVAVAVTFASTTTGSNEGLVGVDVYEVSGVAATGAVDQVITHTTNSSTSFSSSATGTTTQASEIAFGLAGFTDNNLAATITPPVSPWVNEAQIQPGGSTAYAQSGYQVTTTTKTLTYAGTSSVAMGNACLCITLAGGGASNTAAAALTVTPAIAAGIFTTHPAAAALTVTPAIAAHLTATHAAQAALAVTPAIRAVLGHTGLNTTAAALTVTPVIRATLFKPGTVTGAPFRVAPDDGHSSHRHRRRPLWG